MLPPDLLQSIAEPAGGRVALIIGAGCSVEPPTSLPLSRQCSIQAHEELLADGVLAPGDCPDPSDLSVLADTVVHKTGSQNFLIRSMHPNRFKVAEPNEGHLLAAILLRERALNCIVTLNFDLALSTALGMVGGDDVEIIQGPEDHGHLGTVNLVYLHRNANSDPSRWILTTDALDNAWIGAWEDVIGGRFLTGSTTVFVGLGSPAGVLLHSVIRLLAAVPTAMDHIYLADPGPIEQSRFLRALNLPAASYVRVGWSDFMRQLADRVLVQQLHVLNTRCDLLVHVHGLPAEDLTGIWTTLRSVGLKDFGSLRSRWALLEGAYLPSRGFAADLVADLLLAVGCLERLLHALAQFERDGVVEFRDGKRIAGVVVLASGGGLKRWSRIDTELRYKLPQLRRRGLTPRCALVSGVLGSRTTTAAESIIGEEEPGNLISGASWFGIFSADELRQDPNTILEWMA